MSAKRILTSVFGSGKHVSTCRHCRGTFTSDIPNARYCGKACRNMDRFGSKTK